MLDIFYTSVRLLSRSLGKGSVCLIIFTEEKDNRDSEFVPAVSLGYRHSNGRERDNLLPAAIEAVNGEEEREQDCTRIQALLVHSSSEAKCVVHILQVRGLKDESHIYFTV